LQELSARQLALEIGVKPSALYMRLRRREERTGKKDRRDGRIKLTPELVTEIRHLFTTGSSQAEICREFGFSPATIHGVVHRKTWKQVP
jgi:DNA-binding NarL/FixJ family response regulator